MFLFAVFLPGEKDLGFVKSLTAVQRTEPSSMVIDFNGLRIRL